MPDTKLRKTDSFQKTSGGKFGLLIRGSDSGKSPAGERPMKSKNPGFLKMIARRRGLIREIRDKHIPKDK